MAGLAPTKEAIVSTGMPRAAVDTPPLTSPDGRNRVVIENVTPQVDDGRYPIKRVVGERVRVSADIFADGHDRLRAMLRVRQTSFDRGATPGPWREIRLAPLPNDVWTATLELPDPGWWEYAIVAWVDRFGSWRDELRKKHESGLVVSSELAEGAQLLRDAADGGEATLAPQLRAAADVLMGSAGQAERVAAAIQEDLATDMAAADQRLHSTLSPTLRARVERVRARTGAWYELFPRSYSPDPSRGSTLSEAAARLPAVAAMGFDVVYLPPIHPIGRTHRKGRNNALTPAPGDPGSPWAIGGPEGGHTAVDPGLGTLDDFTTFRVAAEREGLEVALDLAYQCSPDHPWVREHPEWFRHRPDGSIKYAENPPKKYQDIYPFNFDTEAWGELWAALRDVVVYWCEQGVRIFRVDNPHTKTFRFWEWMIGDVQERFPDTIFLSEAFTRPKILRYLAKIGFTQSYTYFTWRNTRAELEEYFTELTATPVREYLRPNLFVNTPDILTEYLQRGGRPAFQVRLVLAATLGASYGIYSGYELVENVAVRPGSEEYMDSEKYQLKPREWDAPQTLAPLISLVNRIRRDCPALQTDEGLRFVGSDNGEIIAYVKTSTNQTPAILVVVNLDPFNTQHGFVSFDPSPFGLDPAGYLVRDLLSGAAYTWHGDRNYVRLDPRTQVPAHIFRLERLSA
jgi:starch synthase (maltosyl-transferring)